jgi:hypothetical protein
MYGEVVGYCTFIIFNLAHFPSFYFGSKGFELTFWMLGSGPMSSVCNEPYLLSVSPARPSTSDLILWSSLVPGTQWSWNSPACLLLRFIEVLRMCVHQVRCRSFVCTIMRWKKHSSAPVLPKDFQNCGNVLFNVPSPKTKTGCLH